MIAAVAQSGWAQSSAQVYLDRMSHSFRELDYRGVFTYEFGEQMESLRIIHVVRDGVERERLLHLDGDPVEYVRDAHQLSCVHPGHQKLRLGMGAGVPLARKMISTERVTDYYELATGGLTRVADRPAREVAVLPRDPYRYGFRLYLDEQTGLLLKSLTLGPRGEIIERFQFVDIEIGAAVDDAELAMSASGGTSVHHHMLEQDSQRPSVALSAPAEPQWVPPGFTPSASTGLRPDKAAEPALMYTDGFATFTLVVEEIDPLLALPTDGRARKGATVAYVRHVTAAERSYVLTVVGEIPLMTARKVARSVSLSSR